MENDSKVVYFESVVVYDFAIVAIERPEIGESVADVFESTGTNLWIKRDQNI